MLPLLSNRSKAEIAGTIALIVLALLLYKSRMQLSASHQQYADQSGVSAQHQQETAKFMKRGKVKITKEFPPGQTTPSKVTTEIGPVTRITDLNINDRRGPMLAPPASESHWLIGASVNPMKPLGQQVALSGGVTLNKHALLILDYSFYGQGSDRFRVTTLIRF
jgi:hypothetical protein